MHVPYFCEKGYVYRTIGQVKVLSAHMFQNIWDDFGFLDRSTVRGRITGTVIVFCALSFGHPLSLLDFLRKNGQFLSLLVPDVF